MIDVQAIGKAKKELNRLHGEIKEANQQIRGLSERIEYNEKWAQEKAQEAAEAPRSARLGKIKMAMYYSEKAEKARTELKIWENRHRDALAQLPIAAGNYDEVREGLPEDIDQRVEIMGKYDLEWLFSAEHWAIDPLSCSLETFEMLCDLQRRTNDALWNHFCKDDYEWESEDLEEIPLQWQQDRLAHAEAFVWSCRIDSDWYPQCDFEEIALETPVAEFQDRLWDFFDEAREEGDRLEKRAEPVVGIDFGNLISETFKIYEPNPEVLKLFSPEPISDEVKALYFGDEVISFSDFTELTGVKKREGVAFEDLFEWAKQNSERLPSPETEVEKIFRALFGVED